MKIIDFHAHLLPGIDDGSRNREMTAQILAAAEAQGIDTIVATPHFYGDSMTMSGFLQDRERALAETRALAGEKHIQILRGAEVAYFIGISRAEGLDALCLERTNLLLLEMPFRVWTEQDLREVDGLFRRGYEIILAHPERFISFRSNRKMLSDILERPVYLQINTGSLLDRKTCRGALRLLRRGDALLGSDCHNLTNRPANLQAGRAVVKDKLGEAYLMELDQRGEELIK